MPFHADVIGSLLRPRYLSEARAALADGRMSNEESSGSRTARSTRRSRCRRASGGCGHDGKLPRFSFLDHLLGDMEGVANMPGAPVHFHAKDPRRTGTGIRR